MGNYVKYREESFEKDPLLKTEYDALTQKYKMIQNQIDQRNGNHYHPELLSERLKMLPGRKEKNVKTYDVPS